MLPLLGPAVKQQRGRVLIIAGPGPIIDAMNRGSGVRMDARVSIAVFSTIGAAALFLVTTPQAMLGLLAYVLLLFVALGGGLRSVPRASTKSREGLRSVPRATTRSSRGPRALARHFAKLVPAVVFIVVLNGLLVAGEPVVAVGGRTLLSQEGTSAGVFFSLRLIVLYAAMVLFLVVTPPVEFARAIYTFVRPFSRKAANGAAFYGFLILSFVPLFADELERIRQAQSFRGADLKKGGIIRRAVTVRALIVPLVMSAIHRSGQLAAVIELRGLRDRVGTSLPAGRPGTADLVLASATAFAVAVFTVWNAGGG
jgi:energy-coupling factor transport system permease protein